MPESTLWTGETAAILLSAGRSTRLREPKQFVILEGETLLHRAVRLAIEAGAEPIWVVLRPDDVQKAREVLHGLPSVILVENPKASEGMGSSLRIGMQAVLAGEPVPDRVLLMVCDQPLVAGEHLRLLLKTPSPHGITAAAYEDRVGVPAVFAREHYRALAQAEGDSGARALLRGRPVTTVDLPEAAFDLDTPEQLQRLLRG